MTYIGSGYDLDNVMLLENIKYNPILSFHTILSFRTNHICLDYVVTEDVSLPDFNICADLVDFRNYGVYISVRFIISIIKKRNPYG